MDYIFFLYKAILMADKAMEDSKKQYDEKIKVIQRYYDISEDAAVYIYFRRKRSFPWKKKSDEKYLFWNAKLQNALISADNILGFDWNSMEYGKEEETLRKFDICILTQSNNLFRKHEDYVEVMEDDEGGNWTYISKMRKTNNTDKIMLQNIGLLPKK
jgi:hypothetical protein